MALLVLPTALVGSSNAADADVAGGVGGGR
jgi:hypothetical protein